MGTQQNAEVNRRQVQGKPPAILDGLIQPSFPFAKVFTCFFLYDCMVFAKTGSVSTNIAGTMRGYLGGYTPDAMVAGAIGTLVDAFNDDSRVSKAAEMAGFSPEAMVAAHKRNFMISYSEIESVEIKGPNFAREVRIIIQAGSRHKFRIDRQSKESANYIKKLFSEYLQGKVIF
jgi:hypothetical protein